MAEAPTGEERASVVWGDLIPPFVHVEVRGLQFYVIECWLRFEKLTTVFVDAR